MSGGHWNYRNDYVAEDIFCYYPNYGKDGFKKAKHAREVNPLEDKQISEIVWDVFCLLHSYDWYISGDISEKGYREDVAYFKKKWLKEKPEILMRREIEKSLDETKRELFKAFGLEIEEDTE